MSRIYSLAYLGSHRCSPAEAIRVAAQTGYHFVGLRLWPNAPGAQQQHLLNQPEALRETLAAQRDTGVGVFDLEIIRIDDNFDPHSWDALYDVGAALKAKADADARLVLPQLYTVCCVFSAVMAGDSLESR